MSTEALKVCDGPGCGGIIPSSGASFVTMSNGLLTNADGSTESFGPVDFCCTAHMAAWLAAQPVVPTPSPAYPKAPGH